MSDSVVKEISWTNAQREVKDSRGATMLVSASSGSGKTTVMINRIADLIASGVAADRLLVTTFTNAAAADMRLKLANGLADRLNSGIGTESRKHILKSIEALDLADIGTLHAFCGDLIRQYYYAADYDPNFAIASESEVNIKKRRAAEILLGEYAPDGSGSKDLFGELYDIITRKRRHDRFFGLVDRVYEYSRSLGDGEGWLDTLGQDDTEIAKFVEWYYNFAQQYFVTAAEELRAAAVSCSYPNAVDIADYVLELMDGQILALASGSAAGGEGLKFPRLGIKKNLDSLQSEADAEADGLRSEVKKFYGELCDMCVPDNPVNLQYSKVLAVAVREYGRIYEELKRDDYELDFGDLEQGALRILSDPDIASLIREKYEYVFVDEYQDINPIQDKIIALVARENNLFMVGDVKQSIYRFRLCDPTIFINKYKEYKSDTSGLCRAYDLNDNFRSVKQILDFNNIVFGRVMTERLGGVDYLRNAMLKGDKPYFGDGKAVKVNLISRPEKVKQGLRGKAGEVYSVRGHKESEAVFDPACAEADYLAGQILELLRNGTINDKGVARKVSYGDIVILCRSMTAYTSTMAARLARYYPVKTKGEGSVTKTDAVIRLIDYLKVVDNSDRDIALAGVLNNEFGGLEEGDLAAIRLRYGYEEFFCGAVRRYRAEMDDGIAAKLNTLYANIERHRVFAQSHTAVQVIRRVIADFDYQTAVFRRADGESQWSCVNDFVAAAGQGRFVCPLAEFVRYIDSQAMSIKGSAGAGTDNAVRFMSVHSSKGLEFPVVFVAGMGNRYNFDKDEVRIDYRLKLGLGNYDTTARDYSDSGRKGAIVNKSKFEAVEDEMRLLYVAMTRASDYLILSAVIAGDYTALKVSPYSLMGVRTPIDFVMAAIEGGSYCGPDCYTLTFEAGGQAPVIEAPAPIIPAAPEELKSMFRRWSEVLPCKSCGSASKYTVTELNDIMSINAADDDGNIPSSGLQWDVLAASEREGIEGGKDYIRLNGGGTELGNAYHYVMYHIDKYTENTDTVSALIGTLQADGVLTSEQAEQVVPEKILRCLNSELMDLVRNPLNSYYAERQFLMYVPANKVTPGASDERVLVQGVIDLMIVTPDGVIIADYKITKGSPDKLKTIYKGQLELYAAAVTDILGLKVIGKWLYSFYTDSIIKL